MQSKITVLVIDKYPIVRWALKKYLANPHNIMVIGEADSLEEALTIMKSKSPDVVVMDIFSPEAGGVGAIAKLIAQKPVQVVAFSDIDTWDKVEAFLDAGGLGLVPRGSHPEEMAKAIEAAANKQRWIAPELRLVHCAGISKTADYLLSRREREVISLIAKGLTSRQIADQLCLSINTIETHRKRIFKKLNVCRSAQLTHYAVKHGLANELVEQDHY